MAVAAALLFGGAGMQPAPAAEEDDRPITPALTAAVQVSTNPDPARGHSTPLISRNPKTGILVIADCEARTKKTVDVYRSLDDGRSWAPGGSPMTKPWTDACGNPDSNIDHTIVHDKEGVLYLAFQASDPRFANIADPDRPVHLWLAKSADDGATFETTRVYEAPEAPEADRGLKRNYRPWVAVDPNDPRFVYVSWMQFHSNDDVPSGNKAMITASSDGGRTWGRPFSLREGDPQGSYEARPAVDGKGVVHVTFAGRGRVPAPPPGTPPPDPAPLPPIRTVLYRSSGDHGQTWTDAKQIEEGNASFSHNRKWGLKADPNSANLYAVWYGHPNPRAALPADDRDVFLRVSHDSGRTWEDRVIVNDDSAQPNVHHMHPNLSVAPNGRLDIVWMDTRNSPIAPGTPTPLPNVSYVGHQDVYYTYSLDEGRTFAPNIKITDRIIDRRFGIWQGNADIHGPTGIVSTDDTVYFTWQDSRNGHNLGSADDTYFASLHLYGLAPAVGTGAADDDDEGVPSWLLIGAGLALGMGLSMVVVSMASRRSRAA